MKEMNSIQNNISDLLKLARKFNCFYLSGTYFFSYVMNAYDNTPRNIVPLLMRFFMYVQVYVKAHVSLSL